MTARAIASARRAGRSIRRARTTADALAWRIATSTSAIGWPLVAPLIHVESALLWDPRRDVDAILREHYAAFFGPAAGPMRDFYATLEAGYERWLSEDPLTLQELGDRYSVSRERARQLEKRMLDRLKKYLEAELGSAVDIDAMSRD